MAGSKSLTYEIGIDAGDAVGTLRTFSGAVKAAMRNVESELDEGASSGEKLAAALEEIGQRSREEFNSAAIAAEEMGRALKAAGSSLDVSDVLPQLQRLGLSFDEITADADKLAVSLKGLDDVKAAGLKDLDATAPGLATKLDEVNKSAESSKSALANMVGNSAQDLGQLSGITGSLGVGIGQLAEYAADARFAGEGMGSVFKNMATIAGPMAGLALVTQAVGTAMSGIAAEKAFRAGLVDQFTDDMKEAKDVAESLFDTLKETGNLEVTVPFSGGFLNLGSEAKSLVEIVDKLGLSWDEVISDIKDPSARARIEDMTAEMVFQGDEGERLAVLWNDYALGVDQYGDAWRDASGQQEIANRLIAEAEEAGVGQAEALEEARKETERLAEQQAQAIQEARDYAVGITDATRALAELSSASAEAGRRRDAVNNVLGGASLWLEGAARLRDIREGIEGLSEAAEDVDLSKALDPTNLGADALLDAFDALRPQIQEKIAEAFEVGGGDKVREVANDYIAQIVEELDGKVSPEEIASILGLDNLEAVIQMSIDQSTAARVRSQLDVLTGLNGETPMTASIRLALEAGTITPEAAEVLVRAQLGQTKVTLPTDVTPPTPEQIAEAGAFVTAQIAATPPTAPLELNTAPAESTAEGFARADHDPATIPLEADEEPAADTISDVEDGDYAAKVTVDADSFKALAVLNVLLALITRERTVPVNVDVVGGPAAVRELDQLTRPRTVDVTIRTIEDDVDRWYRLNGPR